MTNKKTGKVVGKIGKGLFVLLGVAVGDTEAEVLVKAEKLAKLRLFSDIEGRMNFSLLDTKQDILLVSQFTLISDLSGGNRPSFIKAAKPSEAEKLYKNFIKKLRELGIAKVETGEFGAYMEIEAVLDGPVTIVS